MNLNHHTTNRVSLNALCRIHAKEGCYIAENDVPDVRILADMDGVKHMSQEGIVRSHCEFENVYNKGHV